MTPLRFRVLRTLGALQILSGLVLGLATVYSHSSYRASIASALPAVTGSLSATADVVGQVTRDIEQNQAMIENLDSALTSYRTLVVQSRASAEEMAKLLPAWDKTVSDLQAKISDAGALLEETAEKMEFRVPTGLEFEGMHPRISWATPLSIPAQHARQLATEARDLGQSIGQSWTALSQNGAKMNKTFGTTCDTTERMLVEVKDAMTKLRNEDVRPALARMKDAGIGLKAVAQSVGNAGAFVDSLFFLGLAMATSVGLSGLTAVVLIPGTSSGTGETAGKST